MDTNKQHELTRSGFLKRLSAAIFFTTAGKWMAIVLISSISTVAGFAFTPVHDDELVLVSSFGRVTEGPLDPGIHWYMPYFNVIRRYPTTRQFLLITDKTVEPEKILVEALLDDGVSVNTADNVPIKVLLEVSYKLDKSSLAVVALIENFGRSSTQYGEAKIEKLIGDICRNAARSVLTSKTLTEVETQVVNNSEAIIDLAIAKGSNRRYSSIPELGISILTLGYRIKVNVEVSKSRIQSATELQIEELRKRTIAARAAADETEINLNLALAQKRVELAKLRRAEFDESPESLSWQIGNDLTQRWNGSLPNVVAIGRDLAELTIDTPPMSASGRKSASSEHKSE
ncbi:SPFH domain-containing protein [Dokdonella sp.]|uniref:SPFH domain-containing protein n=1 Tax=Dokdonella sp. TaxID=2291710 RepID=UPI003529D0C1